MSYLLFTEDFPPGFTGGVSSWAHDLALALAKDGVHVFARKTKDVRAYDSQFPVEITRMPGRNWGKYKSTWTWLAARKATAKVAIFAHWQLASRAARGLKKKGVEIWVFVHGSDILPQSINQKQLKRTADLIDIWLPVSRSLETRLHKLIGKVNSTVPPMPIQIPNNPSPPTPGGPLLVISRLVFSKGIDNAINWAEMLNRTLHIIGDGPDRERLEKHSKSKNVVFLGQLSRNECLRHIEKSSSVLLLSKAHKNQIGDEGLGLCLLEAASQARGCIGSHSGGIPEAIGRGILIPDVPDRSHIETIKNKLDDSQWGLECYNWVKAHHGAERCAAFLNRLRHDRP